jgi:hypothetical protein
MMEEIEEICEEQEDICWNGKSVIAFISKAYSPIYQFGTRLPQNAKDALAFDEANGNHLWKDAMNAELAGLHEYDTFQDMGEGIQLPGYKKICTPYCKA